MQPPLFLLVRMLVERILAEAFPDETGALRVQQVGLFTLIFMLQGDDEPVTSARLAAITGQADSQVHRQLQKLLKLGLVERTAITSPHGRGRAWHLSIKHTPESERLAQALLAAREASAGKRRG
jgi:predicted transcriptional regulator